MKMWTVKPDNEIAGPLHEACIRGLVKRLDVLGVVKMDWGNHDPEFDRYFIETTSGIVYLDIKYPESNNQSISFSYSEAGNEISELSRSKAKLILNAITKALEISCQ